MLEERYRSSIVIYQSVHKHHQQQQPQQQLHKAETCKIQDRHVQHQDERSSNMHKDSKQDQTDGAGTQSEEDGGRATKDAVRTNSRLITVCYFFASKGNGFSLKLSL